MHFLYENPEIFLSFVGVGKLVSVLKWNSEQLIISLDLFHFDSFLIWIILDLKSLRIKKNEKLYIF